MKPPLLILTFTFVCTILSNAFAVPYVIITYSIGTISDYEVVAVNVASLETQRLASSIMIGAPFNGVGAPPFLGDPCVVDEKVYGTINLQAYDKYFCSN